MSFTSDSDFRYNELMNPIRDLSKNWEIDLTEMLKKYLQEIAEASNLNIQVNFIEAAIIIQGSTNVFVRKVDYLYNLTSELQQKLSLAQSSGDNETEKTKDSMLEGKICADFVSLDHIEKKGNLNMLDDVTSGQRKMGMPKVPFTPLSLIPLDDIEKGDEILYTAKGDVIGNKRDYHINFCEVHSSGCLKLPTLSIDIQDISSLQSDVEMEVCETEAVTNDDNDDYPSPCNSPLPPYTSSTTNDPPEEQESARTEVDTETEEASAVPDRESQSTLYEETAVSEQCPPRRRSERQAIKAQKVLEEQQQTTPNEGNPWSTEAQDRPEFRKQIEKKNTRRLPNKLKKSRAKKEVAPEVENATVAQDCMKRFVSIDSKFLKKMCIGLMSVNDAFEHMIIERFQHQQNVLQDNRKKLNSKKEKVFEEESDTEDIQDDNFDAPSDDEDNGGFPLDDYVGDDNVCPITLSPDSGHATNSPQSVHRLSASEEEMPTYEDCLREHVESYMNDVARYSKTTELTEKVNKWQERIKPKLEIEEEREVFNVHAYGTRILDKFDDNNRKQTLSFRSIVKDKTGWEICRYFLSALQLANNSNVEITSTKNSEGLDEIDLTLLTRKRHQESLHNFGHSSGEHQ